MSPDWWLVVIIVTVACLIVSFLWVGYGTQRLWDEKRRHASEIEAIHRSYTMQARTYGSVPVEKLIGREER